MEIKHLKDYIAGDVSDCGVNRRGIRMAREGFIGDIRFTLSARMHFEEFIRYLERIARWKKGD